ncbi:MAG: N-acetylmuramoyl-L-alanine amidase [Lachnospiraceae bacterium]|nr:N-acetylmuramoyl-L-alanine amidase [Lachnospiraceae bacterium]
MKKFIWLLALFLFIIVGADKAGATEIGTDEIGAENNSSANKVVVVIDPGHGGFSEDDRSFGAIYNDELNEKDIDLATALAMKEELEKYYNVKVYLTRENDVQLSLEERVNYANSVGADVMVSCHYNASEDHLFYGAEIFTSAFGECYMKGKALAQCIMDKWVDDGLLNKGIKTRLGSSGEDYYGVIRRGCETGLPVIIIEHGYLDNHFDYEKLGMPADWERMGRLDAAGIANYYGLSKEQEYEAVIPTVFTEDPGGVVYPDETPPTSVSLNIIECNIETSEVTYEVRGRDSDGKLMYYGLALGEPEDIVPGDFADLMLWEEGKSSMRGTFPVPTGYRGKIKARVYNNYELYSDSAAIEIDLATLVQERAELLEQAAREAEEEARRKKELARQRAEAAKREEELEEQRKNVGDFFFFVGGDDKAETVDPVARKKSLYMEIIALVILLAVLIIIIVVRHRKAFLKYFKTIFGDDLDRY